MWTLPYAAAALAAAAGHDASRTANSE